MGLMGSKNDTYLQNVFPFEELLTQNEVLKLFTT